jgi:metallopeptidase MepB
VTIPAILGFYGDFYGIRFDRIQGPDADALSPTGNGSDLVWNEDVLMYALWDTQEFCDAYPDGIADDGFRGYLYLDLFYREGVKDGQGAYEQGLYPQYLRPDGSRSYASVTAVTNFEKSEDENVKPSLLEFGDLPTIMHELGHCMHDLLSSTSYTRTWGTQGVPIDFVEFPSQFMENFARVPEALKRISYHWSAFSDAAAAEWEKEQGANFTGELPPVALPDDLITHTINATNVLKGLATMNQIFYATYDQALHGVSTEEEAQALDPTVVYNQLFRNITGVPDPTDIGKGFKWSNGETDFTHLVSQYAGNYYAYQWCLVYAEDMFYTKFITDPFNTEASFAYRTTVLQPGGARDPLASLTEYLGRAPNSEGYYQYLGIDGDSSS